MGKPLSNVPGWYFWLRRQNTIQTTQRYTTAMPEKNHRPPQRLNSRQQAFAKLHGRDNMIETTTPMPHCQKTKPKTIQRHSVDKIPWYFHWLELVFSSHCPASCLFYMRQNPKARPNPHWTRTGTQANGTCWCEWESPHCTQATSSKDLRSNLRGRVCGLGIKPPSWWSKSLFSKFGLGFFFCSKKKKQKTKKKNKKKLKKAFTKIKF